MVYFYYESTGNILISKGLYVKRSAEKLKAATTGPGSPLPSSLPHSGQWGSRQGRTKGCHPCAWPQLHEA